MINPLDISNGTLISTIGRGAYGKVEKYKFGKKEYAVKTMLSPGGPLPSDLREVSCLVALDHPNIVKARHIGFDDEGQLYIVMDLAKSDLKHVIAELSDRDKKKYMYQLLCGFGYLHANNILHRDLKPQNLLIAKGGNLEIADFGLAVALTCVTGSGQTKEVATLWYRSPEVIQKGEYQVDVDLWAIGCIIYELYTGRVLFQGNSPNDQLILIFRRLGKPQEDFYEDLPAKVDLDTFADTKRPADPFPELTDPFVKETVTKLLSYTPAERSHPSTLIKNSFFDKVRNSANENYTRRSCIGNLKYRSPDLETTNKTPNKINVFRMAASSLEKIHNWARLYTNTYFYSIDLFASIDREYVDAKDLTLFLLTCLYLSALYNELQPFPKSDVVQLSEGLIIHKDLVDIAIREILETIDYRLIRATCYDLYRIYRYDHYQALPEDKSLGVNCLRFFVFSEHYFTTKAEDWALIALLIECQYNDIPFKHTTDLPRLLPIYETIVAEMKGYTNEKLQRNPSFADVTSIADVLSSRPITV